MKILVAEDEVTSRLMLQAAVEDLGHKCMVASDGDQAWQLFVEANPDVLIADRIMPGLDGLELCRRVRAHSGVSYTYLILATSLGEHQDVLDGMEAGADDYLTKPVDPFQFETCLVAATRVTALHDRLAETLRRERQFASNVSHQLRTPLTALQLRIEDVSRWPGLAAEVRDELVASLADVGRLSNIVTGLLTFSRLGSFGPGDPVELSELARAAAEKWRSLAMKHGRRLRLGTIEPVMVFVPRDGVYQVLDVLIENAILHGEGEITIEALDGDQLRVRVGDEGEGIAPADRERIFARHFRGNHSSGEGIGLSLARELAQSMGARLEVAATPTTAFDLIFAQRR